MSKHNVVRSMNQPASPLRRFSSQTPKRPSSPTIEQLLHSDATRWSSGSYSPTSPGLGRNHEEEDHTPQNKKSVLAKVKERAIRWRQNLRKKKQSQEQDGNSTSSWGVSLDDNHVEDRPDGDPEYLGAPMYESEMAPEVLKETARQSPREVKVTSETHNVLDNAREDNPPNSPKQHKPKEVNKMESDSPTKTLTESVTAKTHNIAAKFQSLTVSTPDEQQQGLTGSNNQKTYDKGVSVKEYLFQKFEPGDDEKALSRAITEAISPKKSSEGKSVVEKMKEAVSLLLGTEEAAPSTNATQDPLISTTLTSTIQPVTSRNSSAVLSTTTSSTLTDKPCATNSTANEAMEEESHGRILQAN